MRMKRHFISYIALAVHIAVIVAALCEATASDFCPKLYHKGVLELDINPAFLNADVYDNEDGDDKQEGLTISSFFHHTFQYNEAVGMYMPDYPPFAPDQVGRIANIIDVDPDDFDFETDYEKLTGPNTTWPNDARRLPDGMLPFEGIIIPQGFHPIATAGRLTIINLEDLTEYIVHESTLNLTPPIYEEPGDVPKFFHEVLFHDMDGDGRRDIVTVRSGFKVLPNQQGPPIVYPPFSELVYYKNPGDDIQPEEEWEEVILYGGPLADPPFMGPDIHLAMHDLDGSGVPEIVATHFFSGDDPSLTRPTKGKIVLYGVPLGKSWSDVDGSQPNSQPRVNVLDDTQGFPFSVQIVDLNGDDNMEVLATNHQPSCMPGPGIPGRVYALEQPESGDIWGEKWTVRVLLDNILPQPTPNGARGPRLAPGYAIPFYPSLPQSGSRPWILLSGDQAGKVWMMKPKGDEFAFETAVVFDINDYYGNRTTQTYTAEGYAISTIGEPAIFYDIVDPKCRKEKTNGSMSRETNKSMSKSSMTRHGLKGSESSSSVASTMTVRHSVSSPSSQMPKKREPSMSTKSRTTGSESEPLFKSSKTARRSKSSKSMNRSKGNKEKHSKSKGRGLKILKHGFLRNEPSCTETSIATIYIPVFEAKEIHILSFHGDAEERIQCSPDEIYDCSESRL